MALRSWIRRLEKSAEGEMIVIPQRDGTVKKFPQSAAVDAYRNLFDRMGAGEDAPSEHPLIEAARNSSDPQWSESFFAMDGDGWIGPVEDLSEH